ncbi:MAG: YkuS family protein [Syntrophomonadaceae bacterium]|nr:YkuS family protein [Syntrophomonadaceae bacterium]
MNKIIAVENNLAPIKDYLLNQGCQVIDVDSAQNTRVDAVVISGSSKDLLGMQDVLIDAPIIDARGKTPSEVWDNIMRY